MSTGTCVVGAVLRVASHAPRKTCEADSGFLLTALPIQAAHRQDRYSREIYSTMENNNWKVTKRIAQKAFKM